MNTAVTTLLLVLSLSFSSQSVFSQTWSPSNGPVGGDVRAFLYTSGGILAATMGGGVHRLINNKWVPSSNGLSGNAQFVSDFGRDDSAVYIATFGGVYRTTDVGLSWHPRNTGLPNVVVHCIEHHQGLLYAGLDSGGVFKSSNSGLSWTAVNQGLADFIPVTVMSFVGDYFLIGTSGDGVYFTEDSGTHWTSLTTGLPQYTEYITALYAVAGNVYAGIWGYGIYYLSIVGGGWQPGNIGLTDASVFSFTTISTKMYCGTENGVHISTDWGVHWQLINQGLRNKRVRALVPDAAALIAGTYGAGIYRKQGGTQPWVEYNNGMNASIVQRLDMSDPYDGHVYACTFGHGVFVRDTLGSGWREITQQLSDGALEVNRMYSYNDTLFLATNGGLYYTTNRGNDWALHDWGMGTRSITTLDFKGDTVYAGTWQRGVYRSVDYGSFWSKLNYGFPTPSGSDYPRINAMKRLGDSLFIAMEPARFFKLNLATSIWDSLQTEGLNLQRIIELEASDSILYAAGWGGIYYSTDYGHSWQPDTLGLGAPPIRSYRLAANLQFGNYYHAQACTFDGRLFIQDSAFGIWRMESSNGNGFSVDHISDPKTSYIGLYGKGVWTTQPIPVELAAFSGYALDAQTNVLEWTTETESGNSGFELLRSPDGSAYARRGFVSGSGTTNERRDYRFVDPARQTFLYRLKQIDYDGTASYSPVIKVQKGQPENFSLRAYPNPFAAQTQISFSIQEAQPVALRITDVLGRIVYEEHILPVSAGMHGVSWNGRDSYGTHLSAGVFICTLSNADGSVLSTLRIVKR